MKDKVGEKHITNEGYEIEIIEYYFYNNCTIKFKNGFVVKKQRYSHIKEGGIKNPYHTSVCGIGYLGIGTYKTKISRKQTDSYITWSNMITRCYGKMSRGENKSYKDCSIHTDWHNFQNFAQWFEDNHVEGFELDKDILVKGNKIYSPETCCYVPKEVNNILKKNTDNRGEYPIGVSKHNKKFRAWLVKENKFSAVVDTVEEAFQEYKIAKEAYIREVAEKYRNQITDSCYKALLNYKVEITD